jgi:hypothetical protein
MKYPLMSQIDMALVDGPISYFVMLYKKVEHRIRGKNPQRIQISLGDYMLRRDTLSHLQFGISGLCLDINRYLEKGDKSFYYQTEGKREWYGTGYDTTCDNERFASVLDSIIINGYDPDSVIEVDCDVNIINGTHRTAALLCLHKYSIGALRYPYKWQRFRNADHYVKFMGIESQMADEIYAGYDIIEKELVKAGATFVLYIWETINDRSLFLDNENVRILNTIKMNDNGLLYQFAFRDPDYRVKNNGIYSRAAERLEHLFQRKGIVNFKISKNCSEGMSLYAKMIETNITNV